jgi:outer membrane protein
MSNRRCLLRLGLLAIVAAGCRSTDDIYPAMPAARLREIDPVSLHELAASRATEPASQPVTQRAVVSLTIEEARRLALENNLDLRVALVAPALARQTISAEEARFEAVFRTDASFATTDQPTSTALEGSQGRVAALTPSLEIPLRTGGSINLSFPMSRSETDNTFSTLNPAYTSDLSASLTWPLLRGAGMAVNTAALRIAGLQSRSADAATRLEVIRILANADRAYWRLYGARKELEVRRAQYDLAQAQLERARRQVAAGVAAEVEVVRAESGVADQAEAVIIAENSLRDRQRELKRILNAPGLGPESPTLIEVSSQPAVLPWRFETPTVLTLALQQRMELLQSELQILQDTISIERARNDLLPLLTLQYTYGINGLGPAMDDSLTVMRERNFDAHRVSARLEVPLGNEAARSQLRRALLLRLQSLRTADLRAQQIRQEVLAALDQLEAGWQRILAAQQRVIMNARVVDLETRQFMQGLRTSTDVLDAQTRLGDAQRAEIAALAEYQIAQVDLAYATGSILGATRVAWEEAAVPSRRER